MGFLSRFEGKMEDTFEGAVDKMFDAPISPVQIAKKAEKQMKREKMVGAGKQYAPTLYTVLVNPDDDRRLFGYYPTLAGETETYLAAKASEQGLVMDGQPLVRFIVDEGLKHGKFDIIAEAVAAPIIVQLRNEEMRRFDMAAQQVGGSAGRTPTPATGRPPVTPYPQQQSEQYGASVSPYDISDQGLDDFAPASPTPRQSTIDPYDYSRQPLPSVPEDELDYSIDYGEYTFNSRDFNAQYDGDASNQADYGTIEDTRTAADGMAAGASNLGAAMPYGAAQPVAADTVVFAGGAQGATPVPARSAVRARLVDKTNKRVYDLATGRLLIGRESQNDIAVRDINASRTHAELRFEPQGVWVITDLGSTNGTFVNGHEVSSHPLSEGDRITIGMTNFVFTLA